jgi:hypothetical protein
VAKARIGVNYFSICAFICCAAITSLMLLNNVTAIANLKKLLLAMSKLIKALFSSQCIVILQV